MGLRQSLTGFWKRNVADRVPRYNFRDIAKAVVNFTENAERRSEIRQDYASTVDKQVAQPAPYKLLKQYFNGHPFLRIVAGARIREVLKNGWAVRERFAKKCTECGREYLQPLRPVEEPTEPEGEAAISTVKPKPKPVEVKICPDCGGLLREPNPQEKGRAQAFFKNPNLDDEFTDIVKSTLKDNFAVDDWYWSVRKVEGTQQYVIYVEDASEIHICGDEHSRLGNGEWFCPRCFSKKNPKIYEKGETCDGCGGPLLETCYVHRNDAQEVTARYGRDEIIHGNSDPWLPQFYGNPKTLAVLTELRSALAMNSFNFDAITTGKVNKLLLLNGVEQTAANDLSRQIEEQVSRIEVDSYTGRVGRKANKNIMVGSPQGGQLFDLTFDPKKMQWMDWMEWWFVKIVGGIYGVQPVMMNANPKGPGGYYQKMQIAVDSNATLESQRGLEEPINEQLLPLMGIRDWVFSFNEVEQRNKLEEAQIWQAKVAAGREAVNSGLYAEITEEGELKVAGVFQKQAYSPASRRDEPMPPQPEPSHPFAVDKEKDLR